MSNVQDNKQRVKQMTRRAIKTSTYIMAPLMIGLAFCAPLVVQLILTDKWLPCVPYLRIFCISYMFWPIHTANLNAINSLGRSDLFLKLEIVKKIVGMILLLITMRISVMAMAYSLLVSSVASQIINSWPNRKLLKYGYLEQLKDILPSIILAICMGFLVSLLRFANWSIAVTLICQIALGVVFYVLCSAKIRLESFEYLINMVKELAKRKGDNTNE